MTQVSSLTWLEFEARAHRAPYWVLAVGSVEQHGPHLPLSSDTLVVETLAEEVCSQDDALLLGVLEFGTLFKYSGWPGAVSLPAQLLADCVVALGATVAPYSNRLLLLNGHDENQPSLLIAAQRLVTEYHTDVVVVEWAELVGDVLREAVSSQTESHAGEGLTSLLMHWRPGVVRANEITAGSTAPGDLTRDDIHSEVRAHHATVISRDDVPSGIVGDPTASSSATGAVIASALVERARGLARERKWL